MRYTYIISAIHITAEPVERFDTNHITNTIGWYPNRRSALKSIRANTQMISEDGYSRYAVLEKYKAGLCQIRSSETWFEYFEGEYRERDKPERFDGILNFGM